ncbi:MAG: class I SAM-dependent methyltransferase [Actinomycetota bacterium]
MTVDQKTTQQIQRIYDDLARDWRRHGIGNTILGINRHRSMFKQATGDVLDVACGTGENFKYLTLAESVTATDLSSAMVARARRRTADVTVTMGDAQAMEFEDDSFDTVVSALSTCTFPDYVAAFNEMRRVVKPGGAIMLLEHGRSSIGWIARRQDRSGVYKSMEHGGCRSNRDVGSEIDAAGLNVVSHQRTHFGMIHRFVIEV